MSRPTSSEQQGFTLVELLIVIAIIAILAGLITTGIGLARKKAMKAKTASAIEAIKTSLSAYNRSTGKYPGSGGQPKDDPDQLFRGLYTATRSLGGVRDNLLESWSPNDIGLFTGFQESENAIYDTPSDEQLDFTTGNYTPMALLDPWGRPYHYIEWDSKKPSYKTLPGTELKRKGKLPFMIWSDGPNMQNDFGKEDDITSWGG
ncbi:MAG: prepilin-type N-terminal cleavage/methylation domain-containing protein [Planctomycetota bacterium]|jgi:prepilin-type N-terminal cleavage/methylation domain-containing protein